MANGAFAIGAIGSMMELVGRGQKQREGLRMGMWGAAQAIAFGIAGLMATLLVDAARLVLGDVSLAYATVFALQAAFFIYAALLARRVYTPGQPERQGDFSVGRMALELE
jgi:BCD family chlorophyll transporter-like MFS transporter